MGEAAAEPKQEDAAEAGTEAAAGMGSSEGPEASEPAAETGEADGARSEADGAKSEADGAKSTESVEIPKQQSSEAAGTGTGEGART
ncbi:hypothetical protein [Streptomyces thermospinosisporus]